MPSEENETMSELLSILFSWHIFSLNRTCHMFLSMGCACCVMAVTISFGISKLQYCISIIFFELSGRGKDWHLTHPLPFLFSLVISQNLTLDQCNRECQQQLICHSWRWLLCPWGCTSMYAGRVVVLLCLNGWKWVSGWTGIFSCLLTNVQSILNAPCPLFATLSVSQIMGSCWIHTHSPSRKRTWHLNAISASQRCCRLSNLD